MAIKRHQITIKGGKWQYYVLSDQRYVRQCGDDSVAITKCDVKRIVFRQTGFNWGVVRHELLHAYVDALCIDSAHLSAVQMEEVIADIESLHGIEKLCMSAKMYVIMSKDLHKHVTSELAIQLAKHKEKK